MRQIALTGKHGRGLFALVSDEDYDYLSQFTWHVSNTGYPQRSERYGLRKENKTKSIQMHRDVAKRSGVFNNDIFHDHIDRNKLNNQRKNIRSATRSINGFNRVTELGKSGYRGVKQMGDKWQARVGGNKNRITLGTFATPEEAARAYIHYTDINRLVVPDA